MNYKSYEYKNIDGCSISLDVYDIEKKKSPVIVYIHGGGFIFGSRGDIVKKQIELYNKAGYTLVSIDYRLAPYTKLKDIISDINDALGWIYNNIDKYHDVDTEKIAVIGSSAGGYLALMSGCLEHRPRAIISFYGYGDIYGDWASKASEHYIKKTMVPYEAAKRVIESSAVSQARQERFLYYLYCRQSGKWVEEITGLNRLIQKERLKELSPYYLLDSNYPRTLLIHGTKDTDVPYEESLKLKEKLDANNVENLLISLEGVDHNFDTNMDREKVIEVFVSVIEFLDRALNS